MKEIRWAIIGTGSVTEVKSGPGLYKADNFKLVRIYNRTYERSASYAERHKVGKIYKDPTDLFNDSDIDVVYIATPPKFHKEYAIRCLTAGKIPYIEKPLIHTQ